MQGKYRYTLYTRVLEDRKDDMMIATKNKGFVRGRERKGEEEHNCGVTVTDEVRRTG